MVYFIHEIVFQVGIGFKSQSSLITGQNINGTKYSREKGKKFKTGRDGAADAATDFRHHAIPILNNQYNR